MVLFYASQVSGDFIELSGEESKHCTATLRMGEGDIVHVTDGKGYFYKCEILSAKKGKPVQVTILEKTSQTDSRNYRLHIAIAPTKNLARFEWFLEKAVEIGIDEITPLISEHSERKTIRADRLEKITIAAMKQSLKAMLPVLNPAIRLNNFLERDFKGYQLFAGYCGLGSELLKLHYKAGHNAVFLIGPEGDFSHNEIKVAASKGFVPVSFGNSRMRTETAGIVACHSIYLLNQL